MPGAFDGLRIVDVTEGAHGPWAGAILAGLGGDVIKIERPGGEFMRRNPGPTGHALPYIGLNHSKRSIVLDLTEADDKEIALKLIERCDIFLENWRAGVADRLGLGYKVISKTNPRIIYASGSGYGYNNKYSSKPGLDNSSQAMSGMASISGAMEGPGERARFQALDLTSPISFTQSIVFALIARERTGEGQWVQCSQTGVGIALQAVRMAEYFATGQQPEPLGSASPNVVPSQSFKTRDGFIDVDCPTQEAWQNLCRAVGLQSLTQSPNFKENADRVKNRSELISLLGPKFLQESTDDLLKVLEAHDVPASRVVWSVKELYSNPQIAANELIVTKQHPVIGPVRVPAFPWIFSRTPAQYKWVGPVLGAHQEEVLRELGKAK